MFYVYMIKNNKNELYTGITADINSRLKCHNNNQGALFTKNKNNFKVAFLEEHSSLKEARKREIQIKKWRREKKEFLIKKIEIKL